MEMDQQERDSIRTASSQVSQQFQTLINADDLATINQSQHLILGRLQDSNAVLSHFNEYSERCFAEVSADFHKNTRLLKSMKSDLDYIFQKLRPSICLVVVSVIGSAHVWAYFATLRHGEVCLGSFEEHREHLVSRNMKTKIRATYPDAFSDGTESKVLDQRPDLERPQQ
ncbi:hypothetical protein Sjap_002720 [Stephania japonica]|uniref:KxDL domain-containing protein n=1 Tax=Stephania japonica TaxID=461633 RepID=A0AAP0KNA7_9MAGN